MKHVIVQSVKDANRCIRRINKNGEMLKDVKCSTLIETAKDEIEKVEAILIEGMKQAAELAVTLEVEAHTGTNWYEAK